MNKNIDIGGRLHSTATGNVVAGANEIFDDSKNKKQSDINTETYSLVNNINERLNSLSPDQQSALNVATKATNNETKLGYYVCDTEGNLAAKVISDATGYILSKGGSIKIKMINANTVNNTTLNINSTGAKALYYDGERASANNSWEAGETIEVYYDGTSYYANNVAGVSSDGVFDVSIKYPTSGVEGGNTYTLEGALSVLNTNLSSNKKKGGMSIKFVQSSDHKYVQYRLMSDAWSLNVSDWQGVDDKPTAGSNNLVKSGGVYNLNKKLDIIKGVDNTDLTKGYYYDNTNGNKVSSDAAFSTLIDIPAETKEITFNCENSTTAIMYGIALYDAYVSELTDENISSHFIKGFNEKSLNEVPRIVIDSSYKSIAISSGNNRTIQVIFSPKVSSVKYGSRLIDVFYLNDSSARSLKGKSLFLRTLNKSTGTISFRDSNSKDYNIFSTKKKGKELLICKDDNYVYLGVLVDWDIVDYDFTDVPKSEENTIVLSTPKSSEGQCIFDMFFNKKYRQTGNTIKNGDGVISEYDCVWEDGTTGHVKYTTYNSNVLEYASSIVTYGSNYAVHYGLKTFDEFGNIVSETGLEIRIV